jgi:WD40 repeat protein
MIAVSSTTAIFLVAAMVLLARHAVSPTHALLDPSRPLQAKLILKAQPVRMMAWSPDSTILATTEASRSSLYPDEGTTSTLKVDLWDASSGTLLSSAVYTNVTNISWSPNSNMLAIGLSQATIKVVDRSGRELYTLVSPLPPSNAPPSHDPFNWATISFSGEVLGLSWSPDGRLLASASYDPFTSDLVSPEGVVHIWDISGPSAGGKELRTLEAPLVAGVNQSGVTPLTPFPSWLTSVQWSPDGKMLAAASPYVLWVWDTSTWSVLHVLHGDQLVDSSSGSPYVAGIEMSGWSPAVRSQAIAATIGGKIDIWDAPAGQLTRSITGIPQPTPTATPNPPPTVDPTAPR